MSEISANIEPTERYALARRGLSAYGDAIANSSARWMPNAVRNIAHRPMQAASAASRFSAALIDSGVEGTAWSVQLSDVEADFSEGRSLDDMAAQPLGFEQPQEVGSRVIATPVQSMPNSNSARSEQPMDSSLLTTNALPESWAAASFDAPNYHAISDVEEDHARALESKKSGHRSSEWPPAAESFRNADDEMDTQARRVPGMTNAVSDGGDQSNRTPRLSESDKDRLGAHEGHTTSRKQALAHRADAERFASASDISSERSALERDGSSGLRRTESADAVLKAATQTEHPGQRHDVLRPQTSIRATSSVDDAAIARERAGSSRVGEMGVPDARMPDAATAEGLRRPSAPMTRTSAVSSNPSAGDGITNDASASHFPYRNQSHRPVALDAASIAALLAPPTSSGPSVTIDRVHVTVQAPQPKHAAHPTPVAPPASFTATTARSAAGPSGYRSPWASYFTRHD